MKAFLLIFIAFLAPVGAKDLLHLGDVPEAPADGIYDPDQWLTAKSRTEMARSIGMAKSNWQAEIYVVIFSRSPEIEEAILAQKVAKKWGSGKLWGVVMYVIGDAESPMFFGGRKDSFGWSDEQEADFSESVKSALDDVRGRASREEDQRLRVETGTRELCDELGYLGLVMERIEKRYDSARGKNLQEVREKQSGRKFLTKLAIVLVLLAALVAAIAGYLFKKKRSESRSNYSFPETSPRRRLLAPWSGGSGVIVKVGSRLGEDGSRKG